MNEIMNKSAEERKITSDDQLNKISKIENVDNPDNNDNNDNNDDGLNPLAQDEKNDEELFNREDI